MVQGLTQAVLTFIAQYGLLAVFVYMVLETSLLLHFVPSELVIPVAASRLVTDPVSFLVFVVVTTAGATLGALVPYLLLATFGHEAVAKYGRYIHLSLEDLDRGDRWFTRWGESSVFWGRLLPILRAFISVPAGLAEMRVRRFVLYTMAGSLIYNTVLTYAVYTGLQTGSPLNLLIQNVLAILFLDGQYVLAHPLLVGVEVALVLGVGVLIWENQDWIRAHPGVAKRRALRVIRLGGLVVGLLFLTAALSVPEQAYTLITWAWNDPRFFILRGASKQLALVLTGLTIVGVTLLATELVRWLPLLKLYRTIHPRFRG